MSKSVQPAEPKPLRVTKSNSLIGASYRLTLNEQRLLLAAISRIDPRRMMPKRISVSAVDYAEIYNVPLRHAYQQMKSAADELYDRDLKTYDGKGLERKRWVDRAMYLEGEGRVELNFTTHVIPYLTMLAKKVTSYDLRRVACLDSSHSIRLFEMLMQFKSTGWAYYTIDVLRTSLGLSEAYSRFNNLRQRVIDPSVAELRAKSNLDISYTLISSGRKTIAIRFEFSDLAQLPLNLSDEELPPLTDFETIDGEWLMSQSMGELADAEDAGLLFTEPDEPEQSP